MPVAVITGVSGALGRRVVSRLADDPTWSAVGLDRQPFPASVAKPRHFTVHRVNLDTAPLVKLFEGADTLIHLATVGPEAQDPVVRDAAVLRRVLDAAASVGIREVVVLSSAVVYGARSDNPVPITEAFSRVGESTFVYAAQKLAAEAVVGSWKADHPNVGVAVLRPATTLGHPDARAWLADAVQPRLVDRLLTTLPPTQFVHIDDLADAVVHAAKERLDGPFNVASDGWLTSTEAHELQGPNLAVPIPDRFADPLRSVLGALQGRRPPGADVYAANPWVIASDRLKATGWSPRSSSAEAFVAAKPPNMFARLYARRRQEVTLALAGVGATSSLAIAGGAVRWWLRRRVRS